MPLADVLAPDAVFPQLRASSKKQVLQELSQQAAHLIGRDQREIFETLLQRERLGCTGVGNGIAIPHGKLPKLDKLFGIFARLDKRDGKPQYLRHLPRVWTYLQRALAHPALAPLADWYGANIPAPDMTDT